MKYAIIGIAYIISLLLVSSMNPLGVLIGLATLISIAFSANIKEKGSIAYLVVRDIKANAKDLKKKLLKFIISKMEET